MHSLAYIHNDLNPANVTTKDEAVNFGNCPRIRDRRDGTQEGLRLV